MTLFDFNKPFDWINEEEMLKGQLSTWRESLEVFLHKIHNLDPDRVTVEYLLKSNKVLVDNRISISLPKKLWRKSNG